MPISFGCVLRVFSIKVSHVENDSIMPCTCNNFLLKVDGKIHLCILAHLIAILVGELVLYVTPCLTDAFASLITIFEVYILDGSPFQILVLFNNTLLGG